MPNTLAHGFAGKEVTYSISELAHEFDITPRTIRYYEDEGLITPTREGQTRIYSHKDKIRLKLTLRGKRSASAWRRSASCSTCMTPTAPARPSSTP